MSLCYKRKFCPEDTNPFDTVEWGLRDCLIEGPDGPIFEQLGVEAPCGWSDTAVNIVASKYFYGQLGTVERETSVRQMIGRVVKAIEYAAYDQGYFDDPRNEYEGSDRSGIEFWCDLAWLILHQHGSFNSPVWFNVGLPGKGGPGGFYWDGEKVSPVDDDHQNPQVSGCFIQSVDDNMQSIMQLAVNESNIYKAGSGSGVNLSKIRGASEELSGGGKPSGPLSFMKIYDAVAGVVKSGGKTRRAAAMRILDCDHPDILAFIECKVQEEIKAQALAGAGFSTGLDGEVRESIQYQNANLSVRVTDEFMEKAGAGYDDQSPGNWELKNRSEGLGEYLNASSLLYSIADAARLCGDPGIIFGDRLQEANPEPEIGEIRATNPCGEFQFFDNSACNLASLNLMKFKDGMEFDYGHLGAAAKVFIIAQDILVDLGSYPTREICRNTHDYRPLGLGYCNLGALLMSWGIEYGGTDSLDITKNITQLMATEAWNISAELAFELGSYPACVNKTSYVFQRVMEQTKGEGNKKFGNIPDYRNCQTTLLAPTGTISFMMDCESTGIEPVVSLNTRKKLVGGGYIDSTPKCFGDGQEVLGYARGDDCSGIPQFKTAMGHNCVSWQGHLAIMAAAQPYLSGGISKTVNLPAGTTTDEIIDVYTKAWEMGLKAVAVYVDKSKTDQPLEDNNVVEAALSSKGYNPAVASRSELVFGSTELAGTSFARQRFLGKSEKVFAPEEYDDDDLDQEEPNEVCTATSFGPACTCLHCQAEDELLEEYADGYDDEDLEQALQTPHRRRLPYVRPSVTHKFEIDGHEGYAIVGLYANGQPGELFVMMSKGGTTLNGLMDAFATAISICLQYGVPLQALCKKFQHQRFAPAGFVDGDPEIRQATSIVDYIFTWLEKEFLTGKGLWTITNPEKLLTKSDMNFVVEDEFTAGEHDKIMERLGVPQTDQSTAPMPKTKKPIDDKMGMMCNICGADMQQSGACWSCPQCGESSGCG